MTTIEAVYTAQAEKPWGSVFVGIEKQAEKGYLPILPDCLNNCLPRPN
jgi:hypothetical protein